MFTKAWQGLISCAAQARKQILGTLTMEGRVCELGATDRYWQALKESLSVILGQKHSAARTFSISDHQNPGRPGMVLLGVEPQLNWKVHCAWILW